jgi:putative ATP-dependent endonuclease of OLD family
MYLATIEITNFRSIKELRVNLQPGLNVMVGRNNIGKTNLLDSIRHALGPAASRGDSLWLEQDDFYRSSPTADPASTMSVTLTFAGLTDAQRAHFFEIVDFDLSNLDDSKAIVRFEASWPKGKRQASIRRTGGPITTEPPEAPTRLLESLPITFLPALRDAEAALAPGFRSRLALLLRDMALRAGQTAVNDVLQIFERANQELTVLPLVSSTANSLRERTATIAGTDHAPPQIVATDADFEKILRTLHVQMTGTPIGSLSANGLGLNNLLYIAVVLEHLKQTSIEECPLLLVEEPEAHLHPQLTISLAEYLAKITPGSTTPQTLVTTHSPTLAASVPPSRVHVLFTKLPERLTCCNSIATAGMSDREQRELQRMMDVSRATLYFAKAVILVEGISEALLIPALAARLGYDLSKAHISVVPICGVAFETYKKLLDPGALGIPVAIVSDADPEVKRGESWKTDNPTVEDSSFKPCSRIVKLLGLFNDHPTVKVFCSKLTLEYDLAEAADANASVMAAAWESCFDGTPRTFSSQFVNNTPGSRNANAMAAWRGICRADNSGTKAEFAHQLSAKLAEKDATGHPTHTFEVPSYLRSAIEYVFSALTPPATAGGTASP